MKTAEEVARETVHTLLRSEGYELRPETIRVFAFYIATALEAYAEDVIRARMPSEDPKQEVLDDAASKIIQGYDWPLFEDSAVNFKWGFECGVEWLRDRMLPAKEGK